MPNLRHRDRIRSHGELKGSEASAARFRLTFICCVVKRSGDESHQIGRFGNRQRRRESRHDRKDAASEAEFGKRLIDRPVCVAATRGDDMTARGIKLGRDRFSSQKGMTLPHHAHEPIPKKRLNAHLRSSLAENANLKVDEALP